MSPFGPSVFFFILPFAQIVALGGLIALVVVAARRRRPDPNGRRPFAIYLFSVIFTCVFTILISAGFVGAAIAQAVTDEAVLGSRSCSSELVLDSRSLGPDQGGAAVRARTAQSSPSPFEPLPVPSFAPRDDFPPPVQIIPPDDSIDRPRPVTVCEPTTTASGTALGSVLVALVAAVVLLFHLREANALINKERSNDPA